MSTSASGVCATGPRPGGSSSPIVVLKFGGAAVRTPACFARNAALIAHMVATGKHVIAVVSAMGSTTDDLLQLARAVNPDPPLRELDMLVSTGERVSGSLLAMALHAIGVPAESFTGSQTGIITTEHHSQARIIDVRPERIRNALERLPVVIIAGFQGVSLAKNITTLGRGGTDTTAVAMAVAFQCGSVTFYKEVDGVYTADPDEDPHAQKIPYLTYQAMKEICAAGSGVLHDRAVALAERNGVQMIVRSFLNPVDSSSCTVIGSGCALGSAVGLVQQFEPEGSLPIQAGLSSSCTRTPVYEE
jgi:aspartate kinase